MRTIMAFLAVTAFLFACDNLDESDLDDEPAPEFVAPEYVDNGDGTLTDRSGNGIMWERCAHGETWDGSGCPGSPEPLEYSASKEYCEGRTTGGLDDWRIPTIEELGTLVYDASLYGWFDEYSKDNYWWSSTFETSVFAYALKIPSDRKQKFATTDSTNIWYIRCARAVKP